LSRQRPPSPSQTGRFFFSRYPNTRGALSTTPLAPSGPTGPRSTAPAPGMCAVFVGGPKNRLADNPCRGGFCARPDPLAAIQFSATTRLCGPGILFPPPGVWLSGPGFLLGGFSTTLPLGQRRLDLSAIALSSACHHQHDHRAPATTPSSAVAQRSPGTGGPSFRQQVAALGPAFRRASVHPPRTSSDLRVRAPLRRLTARCCVSGIGVSMPRG